MHCGVVPRAYAGLPSATEPKVSKPEPRKKSKDKKWENGACCPSSLYPQQSFILPAEVVDPRYVDTASLASVANVEGTAPADVTLLSENQSADLQPDSFQAVIPLFFPSRSAILPAEVVGP